ncbi:protoheme IX farnesyltransferase [Thioalkalivibrio denitrificans]|uniref:Protoheme IX farnesyltransferase n=1 Tax=Thioalkalivibrio denitrificans TaxID=108003 RepID=A0A1V3NJK9_9GAMM|nr:heme o synthase [Thioalkalivibrio denitrificans]OOG25164.1 protoheme IX farnesyltransferase [Thioalkalivibrio denitrificans]
MSGIARQLANVFKLRIGVTITFTALAGIAVTPGPTPELWQIVALALAVLISSASAGGYNQYVERDLDARMARTANRPFVTGAIRHGPYFLVIIALMLLASVVLAAVSLNLMAALYVFLGAFFYAVVYTAWLKRRTWLNIVLGGLAGSFAVLAGAAAVDPGLSAVPILLAVVLFLWTPSHFWSLAIVLHKDYEAAGVPMLPVVVGDYRAAQAIFINTLLLVGVSLIPFWYGMGWLYLLGAITGGIFFLYRNIELLRDPTPRKAMQNFHASLIQLTILLTAAILDAWLLG